MTDVDAEPTTVDAVLNGDPELVQTPAGVALTLLWSTDGLMGIATGQLAEAHWVKPKLSAVLRHPSASSST